MDGRPADGSPVDYRNHFRRFETPTHHQAPTVESSFSLRRQTCALAARIPIIPPESHTELFLHLFSPFFSFTLSFNVSLHIDCRYIATFNNFVLPLQKKTVISIIINITPLKVKPVNLFIKSVYRDDLKIIYHR